MSARLPQVADEHLKAVGDHYDFLLGTGGEKGALAEALEQLEAIAVQYEQRGNTNAAHVFRCRISDLGILKTHRIKASHDMLKDAAQGKTLRPADHCQLRMSGADIFDDLERFFKETKGEFVGDELRYEPGLRPYDLKDDLMPIADAINEITKDLLKNDGVYQVSGGSEPARKAALTGLETKYQELLSVPPPPPIPDPVSPPPAESPPSAEPSGKSAASEEASESWVKRLSKEKWVGKKGLAVVGGTVALGGAVYGLSQLLRDTSPQEGQQAR